MNYDFLRLLFTIIVAFLLSYAGTPIAKMLAFKIGAVDIPKDSRRMHKKPIARLGGIAIFFGFIISMLCFGEITTGMQGILIGSIIIVVLGIFDDIYALNALIKFIVQIGAALIVVLHGVRIDHISSFGLASTPYISFGIWAIPITIFWIVGVTNAVNLIDGLDGLAAGVATISTVSVFAISLITRETNVAIVTAAIAGAGFGFLPYNIHPAKIFMGDTGSTFLGFILGCVSVMGLFKSYTVISMAVPFLILGLPLFDTAFAIIRRILQGKSPMAPDRGHIHHRLIDLGFDQKQTVVILLITSGLLSLSAVVLLLCGAQRAIILIAAVMFLSAVGIRLAQTKKRILGKDDKAKAFVFDFDGTLVDSMPYFVDVFKEFAIEHGVQPPEDFVKIITPLGYAGTAEYFADELKIDFDKKEFIEKILELAYPKYLNEIPAKEGAKEFLEKLKAENAKIYLLTASPKKVFEPCLKRLGMYEFFDDAWCCEDFEDTNDNPEIYKKLAEKIGVSVEEIMFFDDNLLSLRGGRNAGCITVGVYDKCSEDFKEDIERENYKFITSFIDLM